ncbi:MAG: transposase [Ferruginibacter sp.]
MGRIPPRIRRGLVFDQPTQYKKSQHRIRNLQFVLFSTNETTICARVAAIFYSYEWKHLLKEDKYKNVIVDSLKFLVPQYCGMPNHLHIIWQAKGKKNLQEIQNSFIKHTSKEFKKLLEKDNNLQAYEVDAIDRKYNFWQRDSLNVELFTAVVFHQKLNYIHYNPVKANLCDLPEDYHFSSAMFYEKAVDHFGFLENYLG